MNETKINFTIYNKTLNTEHLVECYDEGTWKEQFDDHLVLYEDHNYQFEIDNIGVDYERLNLIINDYEIALDTDNKSVISTHLLNNIDITHFIISIDDSFYYTSDYFHIASRKLKSEDLEKILEEIEEMNSRVLNVCFSKSLFKGKQTNNNASPISKKD